MVNQFTIVSKESADKDQRQEDGSMNTQANIQEKISISVLIVASFSLVTLILSVMTTTPVA